MPPDMAEIDAGVCRSRERSPGRHDHDRDIAIRAVAAARRPHASTRVMSEEVKYCFEDDDLDEVSENMADIKLRRLPVLSVTSGWSASSRWPTLPSWTAANAAAHSVGIASRAATTPRRSTAARGARPARLNSGDKDRRDALMATKTARTPYAGDGYSSLKPYSGTLPFAP